MSEHAAPEPYNDEEAGSPPKVEGRRPPSGIRLPLAQQQIRILANALQVDESVEDVTKKIEELVSEAPPDALYQEILKMLGPLVGEKAKQITGMLFMYKRKPCREGNYCTKGPRCIFLHDKDVHSRSDFRGERRKRRFDLDNTQTIKRQTIRENKEVIFNKVPVEVADEGLIAEYAGKYGEVHEVKKLNDGKYLIKFGSHSSAQNLVESPDSVLNIPVITKFFNVMPTRREESLDDLFSNQQEVLNNIYKFCTNKDLFLQLKYLCLKIQRRVEERASDKKRSEKELKTSIGSLYVNQFK